MTQVFLGSDKALFSYTKNIAPTRWWRAPTRKHRIHCCLFQLFIYFLQAKKKPVVLRSSWRKLMAWVTSKRQPSQKFMSSCHKSSIWTTQWSTSRLGGSNWLRQRHGSTPGLGLFSQDERPLLALRRCVYQLKQTTNSIIYNQKEQGIISFTSGSSFLQSPLCN